MKTLKLATVAAALFVLAATQQAFGSPNDQSGDRYVYVTVTGSRIPQKVKVKPIGTNTVSAVRVYDRHEIYQTGRFNTRDVLAQDPSLNVTGH